MRLGFLLALVVFCIALAGKSFAQDADLSAEEIIQILQQNPDVLAEAKAEIVSQLRDRGYNVSERDITDDRLFNQIRSDDRVRQLAANELAKRGFGPAQENEQMPDEQIPSSPQNNQQMGQQTGQQNNQSPFPQSTQRQGTAGQQGMQGGQRGMNGQSRPRRPQTEKGPTQEQYPLRNLPALRDLYTQATVDETKLERFGAALFRNSAAVADKSTLSVPVGPDYILGPGDELVIDYWGASSQHIQRSVDREGRISIPEAGSTVVAGRTLGEVQQTIQKMLSHQLRGISVDVTLGKLRTVRVYVVGDVKNPAAYDISSLST
ncbi:MAG TPA: polysaccharide biosynthesis/export family protein, partial [Candidatus Angelobacter sp.]